jgi:hypothetical protein
MTYVPDTHVELPPTFVEYEKVPEDVTAWIAESSATKEPWSCTVIKTASDEDGVGLIVPEMV